MVPTSTTVILNVKLMTERMAITQHRADRDASALMWCSFKEIVEILMLENLKRMISREWGWWTDSHWSRNALCSLLTQSRLTLRESGRCLFPYHSQLRPPASTFDFNRISRNNQVPLNTSALPLPSHPSGCAFLTLYLSHISSWYLFKPCHRSSNSNPLLNI